MAKAAKILKDAGSVRYTILVPADDGGSRATILSAKGAVTWSPTGVRSATGELAVLGELDTHEPKALATVIGSDSWTKDVVYSSESDETTLDPKWTLIDATRLINATDGAIAWPTKIAGAQGYLDVVVDPATDWSDGGTGSLDERQVHFYDATLTNTDLARATLHVSGIEAAVADRAVVLNQLGLSGLTQLRLVLGSDGTPFELRISQRLDTAASEQVTARAIDATGQCPPSTQSTLEPPNGSTTPVGAQTLPTPDVSESDYVTVMQLHDLGAKVTIEEPASSEVDDQTEAAVAAAIEARTLADKVARCLGTTNTAGSRD